MSFQSKQQSIGLSDTTLFEAPSVNQVSAHTIFLDNQASVDDEVTLKFFQATSGETNIFQTVLVPPDGPYTFPKAINLAPRDRIIASSANGTTQALVSAFVDDSDGRARSFNTRGQYDSTATYNELDIVSESGLAYIANVNGLSGDRPPSSNWTLIGSAPVESVAGRTGTITLTPADIGLDSVLNEVQVINGGGVPSMSAGTNANRPAAATAGRLYLETDTQRLLRDTGTAWETYTPSIPVQSVAGKTGTITLAAQDVGLGNVLNSVQVINNGAVPSMSAGTSGNRPTPGSVGRIYFETDTRLMFRDDGTAWNEFAPSPVDSVNGRTGQVALSSTDVGLGNLLNNQQVVNGGGTPEIISDTNANRPNPGSSGRLYLETDTQKLFRDNGSTWILISAVQSVAGKTGSVTLSPSDVGLGSVLNVPQVEDAGGTPSMQADTAANLPTAGTAGRVFLETDTGRILRDNGTTWQVQVDKRQLRGRAPYGLFYTKRDDVSDPSGLTPADGEAWIVPPSAINAWSGHDTEIAWWDAQHGLWQFIPAKEGLQAWVDTFEKLMIFDGSAWVPWSEFALFNGGTDLFVGGSSSAGFGDKNWATEGFRENARFELYRSTNSARMMVHQGDGSSEAAVHLRRGTTDWEFVHDGTDLQLWVEKGMVVTFSETKGLLDANGNKFQRGWELVSGNVTRGDGANLSYDTTGTGGSTLTLESSPRDGAALNIIDAAKNFATASLTIDGNGNNVDGAATQTFSTSGSKLTVVYTASAGEWKVL